VGGWVGVPGIRPSPASLLPKSPSGTNPPRQVRHGLMVVGLSFGAKTCMYKMLAAALGDLEAQGLMGEHRVQVAVGCNGGVRACAVVGRVGGWVGSEKGISELCMAVLKALLVVLTSLIATLQTPPLPKKQQQRPAAQKQGALPKPQGDPPRQALRPV